MISAGAKQELEMLQEQADDDDVEVGERTLDDPPVPQGIPGF